MEPNPSQVIAFRETRMDQDRKLKTALDESRLLILGAQVLFGFLFQAVFQDLFKDVPLASRALQCAGLGFMLLSICFLRRESCDPDRSRQFFAEQDRQT